MSNAQNSKSFKESLKVKPIDHKKAIADAKAKAQAANQGSAAEKGNQGRTKGGMTR